MAVVFVTNQNPARDYKPLLHYGSLAYLTRGKAEPLDYIRTTEDIIRILIHSKADDYLALDGERHETMLAVTVWNRMHPTLPVLVPFFDGSWHQVLLSLSGISMMIEDARDLQGRN